MPMALILAQGLRDYFAAFRFTSPSAYIFAHSGEARSGERIATLRFALDKAVPAAKIRKHGALMIYDTAESRLGSGLDNPPVAVRAAMRNSTITTTMGYLTLLPSHLAQLIDKVPSLAVSARGEMGGSRLMSRVPRAIPARWIFFSLTQGSILRE